MMRIVLILMLALGSHGVSAQDNNFPGFPSGLVYSLDIGTVKTRILKSKKLTSVGNVYTKELSATEFQYRIGSYKTYAQAEEAKKELDKMKYTSTIKAFYNKEPIDAIEASKVEVTVRKIEEKLEDNISTEELNLLLQVLSE